MRFEIEVQSFYIHQITNFIACLTLSLHILCKILQGAGYKQQHKTYSETSKHRPKVPLQMVASEQNISKLL